MFIDSDGIDLGGTLGAFFGTDVAELPLKSQLKIYATLAAVATIVVSALLYYLG
ncbi:MAG: hypothetical protein HYS26_03355 [Candidatus Kaiserbacteria bacterium]|nr:MAG: hypothetical protein HYS26_03355 [Candidatus Kaiserbacteria bacterium]